MFDNIPDNPRIDETALRVAGKCRYIIQTCLREEEWGDADHEFFIVIREELNALARIWRREGEEDVTCPPGR